MKCFLLFLICVFKVIFSYEGSWAEVTLKHMSVEEKIGQLFVVPACPLRNDNHYSDLLLAIEKYHIGGVIVKASDVSTQVSFLNTLQNISKNPLLVCMDGENGIGMRVTDGISFPLNLTLGAIEDDDLLFELGKVIGAHCKNVGGHINLAPVVDVNNNPLNPRIHMRSFGDNPVEVAKKAMLITRGMRLANVLCCAKHFPGHGDTEIDSHEDLPMIRHSFEHLQEIELFPFRKMILDKTDCIMTAHIKVIDWDEKYPATLSFKILDYLKNKMNFQGLVISDALNMKALKNDFSIGDIAFYAYKAGNNLLLYGDHIAPNIDEILQDEIPRAFDTLLKAYYEGEMSDLDERVLKILKAKEKLNLHKDRFTTLDKEIVFSNKALELKKKLFEKAVTLVKDNHNLLDNALDKKVGYLMLGDKNVNFFKNNLLKKENVKKIKDGEMFDLVIVSLDGIVPNKHNYAISDKDIELIHDISKRYDTILIIFGTPYSLKFFKDLSCVIVGYEEDKDVQKACFDILEGKLKAQGKLPVHIE